ncbi:MAG: DUF5043 domain-containing protein [Bacteroidaceae bacterium]|nr:DUF5043 domain-containing protein [Bacteroidaceae bacterium]
MKRILSITLSLLVTATLFSQTSYYPDSVGTKVFYEDGYAYQMSVTERVIINIYNQDCKWIDVPKIYKPTGDFPDEYTPDLETDEMKRQEKLLYSILEESYSNEEKEKIKEFGRGGECTIGMFINPQTGKVDDVRFSFYRLSYYMNIPVSKFREVELKIKERLKHTVTDYGKNLNYVYDL